MRASIGKKITILALATALYAARPATLFSEDTESIYQKAAECVQARSNNPLANALGNSLRYKLESDNGKTYRFFYNKSENTLSVNISSKTGHLLIADEGIDGKLNCAIITDHGPDNEPFTEDDTKQYFSPNTNEPQWKLLQGEFQSAYKDAATALLSSNRPALEGAQGRVLESIVK